jgi:hypothetical protein
MVGLVAFLGSLAVAMTVAVLQNITGAPLMWPFIFGTAIWAGWDSKRIKAGEYDVRVARNPATLIAGIFFLWIIVFPWYLVERYRIKKGTMPRKAAPPAAPAVAPALPPSA